MITQIGSPTFFFTINAVDTKWHNLDMLMPGKCPTKSNDAYQWRIQNIFGNPHIASQYMYIGFQHFLEEVLQKGLHTTDYWCRYISKHTILTLTL